MASARRRRRGGHHEEEHENEERWLVSYADMMTLLFALFMVLFSISSVNISKFESLQRSLQEAFSGRILPGGEAVVESGAGSESEREAPTPPIPAMTPLDAVRQTSKPATAGDHARAAAREQEDFRRLKRRVDAAAAALGLRDKVETSIRERGLVVRLLTDGVFFDSGRADLKPAARPILDRLATVIAGEARHPVVVEGYTDSVPIRTARFPSNWELSGARASTVVRTFAGGGVSQTRLSLSGYGPRHPIASNSTAPGRSRNRRVEVVLTRLYPRNR